MYTLLDCDIVSKPQIRTTIVANELSRYNIDITTLSETRLAKEGSVTEYNGYIFFWKGKVQNKDHIHGIGFAIRTKLLKQILNLPTDINERLMKIHLPISNRRFINAISAYAPPWHPQRKSRSSPTLTWTFYYAPHLPLTYSSFLVISTPELETIAMSREEWSGTTANICCWTNVQNMNCLS